MQLKLLSLAIICKLGISDGVDLTPEQARYAINQLFARYQVAAHGA